MEKECPTSLCITTFWFVRVIFLCRRTSGKVDAFLKFLTDHTDADLIVKLIDVLPMDRKPEQTDKPGLKMNGYQQMIRVGYIRGRYRDDFSKPKPFVPGQVTDVNVELLNLNHTFKKGHKIMILNYVIIFKGVF